MVKRITGFLAYLAVIAALVMIMVAAAPAAAKEPQQQYEPQILPKAEDRTLAPRQYLYLVAANSESEAVLMDKIITCESGWKANARNPRSTATGLAQFLASTWSWTRDGMSRDKDPNLRLDAYESIDSALWLLRTHGPTQWECYTKHMI